MQSFVAGPNDAGVRISRFVQKTTIDMPNSLLYKSFRNHRIKVNGKKASQDYRIVLGDIIEMYINDEFFIAQAPTALNCPNNDNILTIVWQNGDIAVLFKPSGVLSHSDNSGDYSLQEAFSAHVKKEFAGAEQSHSFTPSLCNRLDRGTEGLVLAAKTYSALRDANELLRNGQMHKSYLAIILGVPKAGLHSAWLTRDKVQKMVGVTAQQVSGSKEITTGITVKETYESLSLCEISLVTGRTHQIRAHMAFLNTPVLGDTKYGNMAANRRFGLFNQALCAYKITFPAQISEDNCIHNLQGMSFCAPAPSIHGIWKQLQKPK